MASLDQHKASGLWRVRFTAAGLTFFRGLETTSKPEAEHTRKTIERTLRRVKEGELDMPMPDDSDDEKYYRERVWIFLRSGGKRSTIQKPDLRHATTLGDAIRAYFGGIPEGDKEGASLVTERIHLNHFLRLLGEKTRLRDIGITELQGYVHKRRGQNGLHGKPVSADTIKKELATFWQFRRYAKSRGWVTDEINRKEILLPKRSDREPFRTWDEIQSIIRQGGLSEQEQRDLWDCLFLSEDEIVELLEYIRANAPVPWLYVVTAMAAFTGARRSEIMRSEKSDCDFQRGQIRFREKKRKRDRAISFRSVDLHPRLREILQEWFDGDHPNGKYTICETPNQEIPARKAGERLKQTLRKGKWSVIRGFHILRHSFVSICVMRAVPETIIKKWVGHQTDEMRERYSHLYPAQTQEIMAGLFR